MRISFRMVILCLFLVTAPAPIFAQTTPSDDDTKLDFFERKIRPLLVDNCFNCHSANTNSKGGLRVDDRNGLLIGGGRGPAIVPGHPEKSLLIAAVSRTHDKVKMPPEKPLSAAQVADLTTWIKDGAAWPKPRVPASLTRPNPQYEKLKKEHWAWQPLKDVKPPPTQPSPHGEGGQGGGDGWARDDIDRFVYAKLREKGLKPVRDADAKTLIRRVTFDLTGLPPTPDEVAAFERDYTTAKPQAAFEMLVDRLLASPAFGERWGRHWLDLARFGESTGSARNLPYPHAWRYRDYVIDAFNADKRYDQFVREQIAGDLLPYKTQEERDQHLIATGFLTLGVKDVNQRFKVRFVMDNIDEQIDAMSRTFLALSASCARCHDHKFDPIPTIEYYALAGIFHSSDHCGGLRNKMGGGGLDYYDPAMLVRLGAGNTMDPKLSEKIEKTKANLAEARAELTALMDDPKKSKAGPEREKKLVVVRKRIQAIQAELISLNDPAVRGPVAMGMREAKNIGDTEIRLRGEAEKLGPLAPRGFLSLLDFPGAPKINPSHSGRLELAQWLTHQNNPLTPRVMVNRVWHHLFGVGLVGTVDNFGVTGEKPSHPELLDHLARQFSSPLPPVGEGQGVRGGMNWSVKKLIRTIVLSGTYQLSGEIPPSPSGKGDGGEGASVHLKIDPSNHLLWRHTPRRLGAEEIRDAMLAVSGKLDRTRPNGSAAMNMKVIELTNNGAEAKRLEAAATSSLNRSIYLPLLRTLTPRSLEVFDFADQGLVTGSRDNTIVATQALYLLNDPFVRQQAQAMSQRLHEKKTMSDNDKLHLAHRLAFGRPAIATEMIRARKYLNEYEKDAFKEGVKDARGAAWASYCQALLASAEFRYVR